ncbi:mobilization protein, partial [Micromonospora aurantiaca]|nr:mobilization protein [Micromonospora aurantiaca]
HVSVRAAPEDPILSDRQWAEVAQEVMSRTGLAEGEDEDGVRWVAVRHADDHIHIVATLAREDGVRPEVWNDGYRIRDACREVERRFG